jgi:hypothetical protein
MFANAEDDLKLPPNELRVDWSELKELKFNEWTIKSFDGWDIPADGGSKVFFFQAISGERFDIMAANPGYWTAEDKKVGRQVFFIIRNNRFYRIVPDSDEERNVIEKLEAAKATLSGQGKKDPKLLAGLIEKLKTRDPMFTPKN